MSEWRKREKPISLPGMSEISLRKIECKVCGNKFIPKKENKYVVKDRVTNGGLQNAFNGTSTEPKQYDAFDCDVCGCQMIAKERLKRAEIEAEGGSSQ